MTLAALGAALAGCYSLKPVSSATPSVGTLVAFDVNDQGRVALGGALGPEIAQVEGKLVEKDSAGYLMAVTVVRLLRGGEQVWTGEQVRVRPEHVGLAYEKKFSLGRSIAMGVVGAGGVAAIIAGRSLIGLGGEPDTLPKGDSTQTRIVRP